MIKKLLCSKGAMDSILVSLLLIIIGLGVVASLSTWLFTQTSAVKSEAESTLQAVINETSDE